MKGKTRVGSLPGGAALLRIAAAAEILETDFWAQYNELGGVQDSEVPGGSGNVAYTNALAVLDGDMAVYLWRFHGPEREFSLRRLTC